MLELFLALSTAWICVAALCAGLSAPALVPLPAPAPLSPGAQCFGVIYFGVSLGRADLEKVCLSQSSLQGKCFSPLTVLALSPHTGDRLCAATHLPLQSWLRPALTLRRLYGMLCSNAWYPATVTLWEEHHRHLLCASQASAPSGKWEGRLRNRAAKGFQGLAKLQKVCWRVM